jgi:predicted secreted hydrolase
MHARLRSLLVLFCLTGCLTACRSSPPAAPSPPVGAAPALPGFRRASPDRSLHFPADHGAHPDYQTEWWYYTGNLRDPAGRAFGYQLTFFRRALLPPAQRVARDSDWAAEQVFMAHFTVTDVAAGQQHAFERFSRGAAGLAGVEGVPFHVWLDDWTVQAGDQALHLAAAENDLALDLRLEPLQAPVLHGRNGYSQKGADPGNASHYYSMPRLASSGTARIGSASYELTGESWMDHEFGTSALAPGQVGWDWFSLQLDDDSELMLFHLRDAAGAIDPHSSATIIRADGSTRTLGRDAFSLRVTETWESPKTGAQYPSGWQLSVPSEDLEVSIEPMVEEQELVLAYVYWEGCVSLRGSHAGESVRGHGYAELTGYAVSMQRQL